MQSSELELIRVHVTKFQANTDNFPNDGSFKEGDVARVEKTFFMEKQEKTSLYHIPYAGDFIDRLGPGGTKLFLYIQYKLEKNTDTIRLRISEVQKNLLMKSNGTVVNAIKALMTNGVICKKTQSDYWINPYYLFKGDRIAYYNNHCPDCIKIVHTTKVDGKSPDIII